MAEDDLGTALRESYARLGATAPTAMPNLATLVGRRARRRRVRSSSALAGLLALAVLAVALPATLAGGGGPSSVISAPNVVPPTALVGFLPSESSQPLPPVPSGWQQIDLNDAELPIPPTWHIRLDGPGVCASSATPAPAPGAPVPCFGAGPSSSIEVSYYAGEKSKRTTRVAGRTMLLLAPRAGAGSRTLADPDLGVVITTRGPQAGDVLNYLRPTGSRLLLARGRPPAVPTGWGYLNVAGVRAAIPPGWKTGSFVQACSSSLNDTFALKVTRPPIGCVNNEPPRDSVEVLPGAASSFPGELSIVLGSGLKLSWTKASDLVFGYSPVPALIAVTGPGISLTLSVRADLNPSLLRTVLYTLQRALPTAAPVPAGLVPRAQIEAGMRQQFCRPTPAATPPTRCDAIFTEFYPTGRAAAAAHQDWSITPTATPVYLVSIRGILHLTSTAAGPSPAFFDHNNVVVDARTGAGIEGGPAGTPLDASR
jgi:hypothetical protein